MRAWVHRVVIQIAGFSMRAEGDTRQTKKVDQSEDLFGESIGRRSKLLERLRGVGSRITTTAKSQRKAVEDMRFPKRTSIEWHLLSNADGLAKPLDTALITRL
jgi:hypothetical protein